MYFGDLEDLTGNERRKCVRDRVHGHFLFELEHKKQQSYKNII